MSTLHSTHFDAELECDWFCRPLRSVLWTFCFRICLHDCCQKHAYYGCLRPTLVFDLHFPICLCAGSEQEECLFGEEEEADQDEEMESTIGSYSVDELAARVEQTRAAFPKAGDILGSACKVGACVW